MPGVTGADGRRAVDGEQNAAAGCPPVSRSPRAPPRDPKILTTSQGRPISDNQSLRSVGERGPATLENYQFIKKITHFDRERTPERVVHAPPA